MVPLLLIPKLVLHFVQLLLIVFVRAVDFQLKVSTVIDHPPPGFLSLCPETDFRTGPSSFTWPACPAYWSLDPSGIERLSTEEATRLGFPSIQLDATVEGSSWESSIYAGLRQFHQGKGFDPESQDVTRHLGYPLLSSTQIDIGFSRVDDKDSSTGEDQCLLNVEDPITEGHGRFSRPDSEDTVGADITLNGTETFFIYSPRDDQPETPIIPFTMKDLTGVRANLGIGGCLMSVHEPAEPASWLEDNWDNPLLISIRNSVTCSGPFAWMLSPTKPALAIFGRYNEPIVINMAQAIADLSGFPVVTRPVGHNPALTLLTHDTVADDGFIQLNNTGGPNQGRRRDLDRDEDTTTEDEGAPEETGPGGNGGRRDNNLDDTEANADVLNPEKQHEANRGAQGGGGGDGGEPTTLSGKSPLHRTRFKLRLKPNAADTYLVNIDHTLKFTVNPDTEIPVGIDDPPKPLFRPEVVAFVDFAIETRPRETQVDRSYANIGFVAHRKDSIDKRKFFRGGFELPRRTYKHGQQRQKQTGIQGGVSVPHNPMVTASISHSRTYGTTIEATDDKVMPRWSVKEEFGEEWEEDETSFSSFDVVYQPQDIRLEIEKSESHPLEVQVAMGINLRPAGSEAPLPQISFIHRNQALIWVSDPASKAQIRGILVLMSSYLDDVMTETRLSIYERADIVLGLGSPVNLPKNEGESGTVSLSIAQVQRQEATSSKGWRTWVPGFFSKDRQGSSRTSLIDIPQHEYLARGWDVDNNRWRSVVWPALDKHFRAATLERTSPVWKIQCPWGTGPMAGGANIQPRGEDTV
ncbi:hypothetical protein K438DRAFT_96646 [Mycena galopus ATCC 62051]|nr:hypothetical protein K438DRAFT_96646 [Mycena galopus ATCC 62051]